MFFFLRNNLDVSECKDRFDVNIEIYPGIKNPDKADLSRSRLRGGGREQPSVGASATGNGLLVSSRATRLKGT